MYVEDRIAGLCDRLIASVEPEDTHLCALELQEAIHDHIEDLRIRVHTLPITGLEMPAARRIV